MTVFIQKGDAAMTERQAINRGLRYYNAQLPSYKREGGMLAQDPAYLAWSAQWQADNVENTANNHFNIQLADYRQAVARLARYELSVGRLEVTGEVDMGTVNENGIPVLETVVVAAVVKALAATVEQNSFDAAGTETTETVRNPQIVADETERAIAHAAVNGIPDEVRNFAPDG